MRLVKVPVDDPESKGKPVTTAYLDGYHLGDRKLEGVLFKFRLVKNKLTVRVVKEHSDYFAKLNQSFWLKRAVEYIHEDKDQELMADCKIKKGSYSYNEKYVIYLEDDKVKPKKASRYFPLAAEEDFLAKIVKPLKKSKINWKSRALKAEAKLRKIGL